MATFTPIDPGYLFQLQQPDYFGAAQQGIKLGQLMRQAPLAEEQQRLANEEAQIKLNQLMDPQSILNQMEQLKLQQQQGVIARQPFEQQLLQSQIKTQEQQQEDFYARENERNRMLAAEMDLAEIAKKHLDPKTNQLNAQGFISEAVTKYPLLAADKLIDLANKFKYGLGQEEKSAWKTVGSPIKGADGAYYQPQFNVITGEQQAVRLEGVSVPKEQKQRKTKTIQTDEGTFVYNADTGELISEIKTPGGKPVVPDQKGYITWQNVPENLQPYWSGKQKVPIKFLNEITEQTPATASFIKSIDKILKIVKDGGVNVVNPTGEDYAKLAPLITDLGAKYREIAKLGVPNFADQALTNNFIGDPTKFESQFKQIPTILNQAKSLIYTGFNEKMKALGFKDISMSALSGIQQQESRGLPKPDLRFKIVKKGNQYFQKIGNNVIEVSKP